MFGIKISRVISVSIFFRLLPHFFVHPGRNSLRLYSGHWPELGSTKDEEIPPSFSSFSYFYSFVLCFPRISRLHYGQSLGSRALTSNGGTKTRNPYPSLAPTNRRRLWVRIHPSLTWPNYVLDTQIISKRALYIIMLISGRISFFQLVTTVLKLICYRQSEREWGLIVSYVISRAIKGKRYDSAVPPISFFPKSPCCHQLRWFHPAILWGYYPTLKLSSIPNFTLILTYCKDNIYINLDNTA